MIKLKKSVNLFLLTAFTFCACGTIFLSSLPESKSRSDFASTEDVVSAEVVGLETAVYNGETFYLIETADQLADVAYQISVLYDSAAASANYALTADINLSGNIWTPIGNSLNPFSGKFNGNGHCVSGIISGFNSAYDQYYGLFGKISGQEGAPAQIYDLIVGEFSYYETGYTTSGSLAGYISNAEIIDVYDLSYVNLETLDYSMRVFRTFGTIGENVKYYAGDTFKYAGQVYKPGINYDPTHGNSGLTGLENKMQFDWQFSESQISYSGYSLYVCDSEYGTIYKNGDETKTPVSAAKIVVNSDGSVKSIASDRYFIELPQQNGADEGQPVIEATALGKKMLGWRMGGDLSSEDNYFANIAQFHVSSSKDVLYVETDWKDLAYNITVLRKAQEGDVSVASLNGVLYNESWDNVIDLIVREGYDLIKLYEIDETDGSETVYYSAEVSFNETWDKTVTSSFDNGETVCAWDGDESVVSVVLYSDWLAGPTNTVIQFKNTNDLQAQLSAVRDLNITYKNGEPAQAPELTINQDGQEGKYTFKAIADQELVLTFKLDAGYKVSSASCSPNGTASFEKGDNGEYTVNISGLLDSADVISIEIERDEISLTVEADNCLVELQGNSADTTLENGIIKTKIGETFDIVCTVQSGYEYFGYNANNFTLVSDPVVSGNVVTFTVNVETFGENSNLKVIARAKAFSLNVTYNADALPEGAEKPTFTITSGETVLSGTASQNYENVAISDVISISVPGNAYYNVGVVLLSSGSAQLTGDNGKYQLSDIAGEAVINLSIEFTKKVFQFSISGKASQNGTSFTEIKDINGLPVTEIDSVITFENNTNAYSFGDSLNFSYDLISQYYEFVGWYYSNGDLISTSQSFSLNGPAQNLEIYGVVKGKTATVTILNGKSIINKDGNGEGNVTTLNKNINNVNNSAVTYVFSDLGEGNFTVTPVSGYFLGKGVIYDASVWTPEQGFPASDTEYVKYFNVTNSAGESRTGYNSFFSSDELNAFIFGNGEYVIQYLGEQGVVEVNFVSGTGASGEDINSLFYYEGEGVDISQIKNNFVKPGYTPSGWSFRIGDQTYKVSDSSLSNDKINFTSYSGIVNILKAQDDLPLNSITVERTYTANTYKLYFNQNTSEVLDIENLIFDDSNNKYYKVVTFDKAVGQLPTITKTGYSFVSWGDYSADTIFNSTEDVYLNAVWGTQNYKIILNANQGQIAHDTSTSGEIEVLWEYGTQFSSIDEIVSIADFNDLVSRKGFIIDSWHWLISTSTGDGTTYTYKQQIYDDTVLNNVTFEGADFTNITGPIITIYAKWEFDPNSYSLTMQDSTKTYNDASQLDFNIKLSVNEVEYSINSDSTNLPKDLGVTIDSYSWLYSQNNTSYVEFVADNLIYLPGISNVAQSGYYKVVYTLKDTKSISCSGFGTDNYNISAFASATINKANLELSLSETEINNILFDFIDKLVDQTEPVLELLEGQDGYLSYIKSANSYNDILAWASNKGENALKYAFVKPFISYLLINNDFLDYLKSIDTNNSAFYDSIKLDENVTNKLSDYTEFDKAENQDWVDIAFDLVLSASQLMQSFDGSELITEGYFAFANLDSNDFKIISRKFATQSQLDQNVFDSFNLDGNVGPHDVVIEISPVDEATFDINNYNNISYINSHYYIILGKSYFDNKILGNAIVSYPYIYATVSSLPLLQNKGVEKGQAYSFNIEQKFENSSEFTKIVATVETSDFVAGIYTYFNGGLLITSYKIYVNENDYYTVQRQEDGSYQVVDSSEGLLAENLNLNNLCLFIDGTFEILAQSSYNTYIFGSSVIKSNTGRDDITITNITGSDSGNYNIQLTSVEVNVAGNAMDIAIVPEQDIYYFNGEFVFQISGNGTRAPYLYATEYVTNVDMTLGSLTPVQYRHFVSMVEWTDSLDLQGYKQLLKDLGEFSVNQTVSIELNQQGLGESLAFNALFTDVAYVDLTSKTDKGYASDILNKTYYVYFNDSEFVLNNTVASSYELLNWTSEDVSISNAGLVTMVEKPYIQIAGNYKLAKPIISANDFESYVDDDITLDDLRSLINIKNENEEVDYSYKWYKQESDSWVEISNLITSVQGSGIYAVEVIASKLNYNDVISDKKSFEVIFNKNEIVITNSSTDTLVYNNQNFVDTYEISWTLNNEPQSSLTLAQMLKNNNLPNKDKVLIVDIKLQGQSVYEIKNVGTYTIQISLYDYVGNDYGAQNIYSLSGTLNISLTITAKGIDIPQSFKITKLFGEADPTLSTVLTGIGTDRIKVDFTRDDGETAGYYDLHVQSWDNQNYNVTPLITGNQKFEISSFDGILLQADISGDEISLDYDGLRNISITKEYNNSENAWILTVKEESETLGTFSLTKFKENNGSQLNDISDISNILNNFEFEIDRDVKDIGTYKIVAKGSDSYFNVGFKFSNSAEVIKVNPKTLYLSEITKEFDQSLIFSTENDSHTVQISGLVENESVIVSGVFATANVGDSVSVSNLAISGEYAYNYQLASSTGLGKIIKSSKEVVISLNRTNFTYGEIKQDDLSNIIVNAVADTFGSVVAYIDFDITIQDATYSKVGYLNYGNGSYVINITATSNYFNIENYSTTITLNKISVSLTVLEEITKVYDKTTDVIQTLYISSILAGDVVNAQGNYDSELPGENIGIKFILIGDDSANYILTNNAATGSITNTTITIIADLNTISFVDGLKPTGQAQFVVEYPFDSDNSIEIFESLTEPIKAGYTFKYWTFGDNAEQLTAQNLTIMLDQALNTKVANISAQWEIQKYTVTVVIDDQQGSYTIEPTPGESLENVHTFNYWDTLTINSIAKTGYVALSSTKLVEHISKNEVITLDFRPAIITFNISVDKDSLYPFGNASITFDSNWSMQSDQTALRTVSFADLGQTLAKEFLPDVSVTGYNLVSWNVGGQSILVSSEMTLKDLILALNPDFTSDISISGEAVLEGKSYTITFDSQGGTPVPEDKDVVFGQKIGELETPTKYGNGFLGWYYGEQVYTESSIYSFDQDITLIAQWSAGVFNFTVSVSHASIQIKDSADNIISSNENVYRLSNDEIYTISVTPDAGYEILNAWQESEPKAFDLSYTNQYTEATVSNLIGNGSIVITTVPMSHLVTLVIEKASVQIMVNDVPVEASSTEKGFTFNAKTGDEVEITVTAQAGYEIIFDSTTSGKVTNIDNVYSLSNFTSAPILTFEASALSYNVTFSFEEGVSGIEVVSGGELISVNNIKVQTGVDLIIKPIFEYGYTLSGIIADDVSYSQNVETGTFTFSDFTNGFNVTVNATKIIYNLNASVITIDNNGYLTDEQGFTATVPSSASYLTVVNFVASKPADASAYRFVGWFEGALSADDDNKVDYSSATFVSDKLTYVYTVSENRTLTAIFEFGLFNVKVSIGEGKGFVLLDSDIVADSADGSYLVQECYYGEILALSANPYDGYSFAGWYNGDSLYSDQEEISVTVNDANLNLIAKFIPGTLTFEITPGVSINGILYTEDSIVGLDYGTVQWGTFDGQDFVVNPDSGNTSTVTIKTDESVYVKISAKSGYTFDSIYPKQGMFSGIVDLIFQDSENDNTVYIYQIYGLNSAYEGHYAYTARFVANSTRFNIKFSDDSGQIDAGSIYVDIVSGVSVSGNQSSNVTVDAIVGKTISVTASVKFGISFVEQGTIINSIGVIENIEKSVPEVSTGYSYRLKFTITYSGNETYGDIEIKVVASTYNIKLIDFDDNGNKVIVGTVSNVKQGSLLDVSGIDMPSKNGYKFIGFYNYIGGVGYQYVTASGVGKVWNTNGYYWNGNEYVKDLNFDPIHNEFRIFAAYKINKSQITVDAVPDSLKGEGSGISAEKVITNLNSANSWSLEDDIFYVEVLYGSTIGLKAPHYDGYQFAYWQVTKLDEYGTQTIDLISDSNVEKIVNDNFPTIEICAVYYVEVSISSTFGGSAYYIYTDENNLEIKIEDVAFIPTDKNITLYAEPIAGYNFIGWFNDLGEEIGETEVLTIKASREHALTVSSFTARFEGQELNIVIGDYDDSHGRITSVRLNNQLVSTDVPFKAKVGDNIIFYVEKDDGYELVWSGGQVINALLFYTYKVDIKDAISGTITITPQISQEKCNVTISVYLNDIINESELNLIGSVKYVNIDGDKVQVKNEETFKLYLGSLLEVEILTKQNYLVKKIMFNNTDITDTLSGDKIYLTLSANNLINNRCELKIYYERDLWINHVDENSSLKGSGTEENPYLISSVNDLSYLAYMINVKNSLSFASAYYQLQSNIDLAGKYWTPIGTEDNPFNGTFEYNNFEITGVSVLYGYKGSTNNGGVFGYLGPNVNIISKTNDLMVALIIVGVVLFIVATVFITLLIIRKRRKKKLEELANG